MTDQDLLPTREWLRHAHAAWSEKARQARMEMLRASEAVGAYQQLFNLHYPGEEIGGGAEVAETKPSHVVVKYWMDSQRRLHEQASDLTDQLFGRGGAAPTRTIGDAAERV